MQKIRHEGSHGIPIDLDALSLAEKTLEGRATIRVVRKALGVNSSHFVKSTEGKTNAYNTGDALPSAIRYAFR